MSRPGNCHKSCIKEQPDHQIYLFWFCVIGQGGPTWQNKQIRGRSVSAATFSSSPTLLLNFNKILSPEFQVLRLFDLLIFLLLLQNFIVRIFKITLSSSIIWSFNPVSASVVSCPRLGFLLFLGPENNEITWIWKLDNSFCETTAGSASKGLLGGNLESMGLFCLNCKMYLFKLQNVFVQNRKYIWYNCKIQQQRIVGR